MSTISSNQAASYAQQAGFSGDNAQTIVAIATAESSLDPSARHVNSDGSIDRGILQINSRWHAEVSDSCAYNPACAFQQGFRISFAGSNFTPWSTYNTGAYRQYMRTANGGGIYQPFTLTLANGTSKGNWQQALMIGAEKVAVFILASLLIFLGFYILNTKEVNQIIGDATKEEVSKIKTATEAVALA